ncbi:MAG: TonB-dependent receptor [Pyrinomonadaceae bacterium]|nr:TonB-dependent receptor [Sphingobacteriaceae bacterium]
MRLLFILFFTFLIYRTANCQARADTSKLEEVLVKAYFGDRPLLQLPASIGIVSSDILQNQAPGSLLPAINTIPGVRMEERSPGSYRLSIRGSLLRSPFGIRNVKIYLDDFILTDAGGNTYLNILDAASVGRIEILKGPEGSIFGANSGGVVLISTQNQQKDSLTYSGGISAGAFGMVHQYAGFQIKKKNFEIRANQAFQRSDGYRENSALNRKSFILTPSWTYSKLANIKALLMLSDLHYQTPGGLNLAQLEENPKAARPGFIGQQTAIYNTTFVGGLSHELKLAERVRHVIAFTGSFTDFKNPFFTNYEVRKENSVGLRTYIDFQNSKSGRSNWNLQLGMEAQQTATDISNSKNDSGTKGMLTTADQLTAGQGFLFSHFLWQPGRRLTLETALSYTGYKYSFKGVHPVAISKQFKKFETQLMPRIAFSYLPVNYLAWRASASRGYSGPTIAEVRPSSQIINSALEPETGWNYETGLRLSLWNNRVYLDGLVFYYNLKNAIVRRVDASDSEYFVNAGETDQKGVETDLSAIIIPLKSSGVLRGLKLREAYTYSNFKFADYIVTSSNFSGNKLTGIPVNNLVSAVDFRFPENISLHVQHNFVSDIPLNDANSVFAQKYHLLQAKAAWEKTFKKTILKVFTGVDNLLNTKYTLGADLNAFGSRYYNPAATINFYAGITAIFNK